jgi:hypothetical protein
MFLAFLMMCNDTKLIFPITVAARTQKQPLDLAD